MVIYMYTYIYIHVSIFIYIYIYMYTYIHIWIYLYVVHIYIYIYRERDTFTCTWRALDTWFDQFCCQSRHIYFCVLHGVCETAQAGYHLSIHVHVWLSCLFILMNVLYAKSVSFNIGWLIWLKFSIIFHLFLRWLSSDSSVF